MKTNLCQYLLCLAILSGYYCVNCEYLRVVSLSKSGQQSYNLVINNNRKSQQFQFNLVRKTFNVKSLIINENATIDKELEENVSEPSSHPSHLLPFKFDSNPLQTPDNFYEDPDHDASVVIEKIEGNGRSGGLYKISGVLGNNLIISPVSNSPGYRNSELIGLGLVKHNVTRRHLDESVAGADYMQLEPGHNLAVSRSRQGKSLDIRSKAFPEILGITTFIRIAC